MSDRRLLVIFGHGSLGLRRMVELSESVGCDLVFAVDETPESARLLPLLKCIGRTVRLNDPSLVEQLRLIRPNGVVTFSEHLLAITSRLAAILGLSYNPPPAMEGITSKGAQRRQLRESGVLVPNWIELRNSRDIAMLRDWHSFPAVLKPQQGAGSRNTHRVSDRIGMSRILEEVITKPDWESGYVLEAELQGTHYEAPWGDQVGVCCAIQGGEITPFYVCNKFAMEDPYREVGGYGGANEYRPALMAECKELAVLATRAVGITTGLSDVEIKLTPEGPRVIEVNGRLGGWIDQLARSSTGCDPGRIAFELALGDVPRIEGVETDSAVSFHYELVPPKWATSVHPSIDVAGLRNTAGDFRVVLHRRPGERVTWKDGLAASCGYVDGSVADVETLGNIVLSLERFRPCLFAK